VGNSRDKGVSVLDLEIIVVLKDVLAGDFPALIDTFLKDAELRVEELKLLCREGKWLEMERPAHTLKGSSANVGAAALAQACGALVNQCREGGVADPAADIALIEGEFQRVALELRAL